MAAITGDFQKLRSLISRLESVKRGAALEQVSEAMAFKAEQLAKDGFKKQADPYGDPWAPVSPRTQDAPRLGRILIRSRALSRKWQAVKISKKGFELWGLRKAYAAYHQTGTRKMPARPMVPTGARGLGNWALPLERAAARVVSRILRGK